MYVRKREKKIILTVCGLFLSDNSSDLNVCITIGFLDSSIAWNNLIGDK